MIHISGNRAPISRKLIAASRRLRLRHLLAAFRILIGVSQFMMGMNSGHFAAHSINKVTCR
jgi:hypothetical protein